MDKERERKRERDAVPGVTLKMVSDFVFSIKKENLI